MCITQKLFHYFSEFKIWSLFKSYKQIPKRNILNISWNTDINLFYTKLYWGNAPNPMLINQHSDEKNWINISPINVCINYIGKYRTFFWIKHVLTTQLTWLAVNKRHPFLPVRLLSSPKFVKEWICWYPHSF